jgi:sulfur-oxidizing protein SoxZ
MSGPMRIRALAQPDGSVEVTVRMTHEMESGQRRDAGGALIPAHFISNVTITHGSRVVLSAEWGPAVSKDPLLRFKFQGGKKGDEITVSWVDNKAQTRTDKGRVE